MGSMKQNLKQKLFDKYRLVILNDDTFEEKISFNLTRLNVFVLVGVSAIMLIALTTVLIAFTPLKEYIPGYSSTELRKKAYALDGTVDSLERSLDKKQKQLSLMRNVLMGETMALESIEEEEESNKNQESHFDPVPTTKEDSSLRALVSREDKFNFFEKKERVENLVLFPPVQGNISSEFDPEKEHYAVDIVVAEGTPVKSVADGRVIFAEWTAETGHVIIIEHSNGLLTAYKHNALLNKRQGDFVKAGEVVSFAGSTGDLSTGPHLHFELWRDGHPLNPTNFIDF